MRNALAIFALLLSANSALAAGIPQLDPTWYASQLFWLLISFGLMIMLVKSYVAPTVGGVLQSRAQAIESAMRDAEAFRDGAEKATTNIDDALQAARATAAKLVQTAKDESSAHAARAGGTLDAELKQQLSAADAAISAAKATAMNDMQTHAGEVAQALTAKLLAPETSVPLKAAS